MEPRFTIGQQFMTRGKHPKLCTVKDIYKTYNSEGLLIKINYVASHDFMGQIVTNYEVTDTAIAMGLIADKRNDGIFIKQSEISPCRG